MFSSAAAIIANAAIGQAILNRNQQALNAALLTPLERELINLTTYGQSVSIIAPARPELDISQYNIDKPDCWI